MITPNRIKSAAGAADYLTQVDDYYSEGQSAPTSWEGQGAESLGLNGQVDTKEFTRMLNGKMPDGTDMTQGQKKRCPGHDLTISAPKTYSALAVAGGDQRLIEGHDQAMRAVVRHIEEHAAITRVKQDGVTSKVTTDNLTCAAFRHSTSRAKDPNLHTHLVVLNATRDANGQLRALETKALFGIQKELDTIYKNELARYAREAGYDVQKTKDGFEIVGVPKELCDKWSGRTAQIDAELEKMGLTRTTATAEQREIAALNSRAEKSAVDHDNLRDQWRSEAAAMGVDLDKIIEQSHHSTIKEGFQGIPPMAMAIEAVQKAQDHLSERQSRFSAHDLEKEAIRFAGLGGASKDEIRQAIELAKNDGKLLDRQTFAHDTHTGQKELIDGYTTAAAVATEDHMLATASRATGQQPVEIITRFHERDRELAALALASRSREAYANPDFKKMMDDGGKAVYDKSGRRFVEDSNGRIHCPDLYTKGKVLESRNINHLLLTKTKYIVTEGGWAFKQGGTLKAQAAGWLHDKISKRTDPDYARKQILEKLRTGEYTRTFVEKKLCAKTKDGKIIPIPEKFKSSYGAKNTLTNDVLTMRYVAVILFVFALFYFGGITFNFNNVATAFSWFISQLISWIFMVVHLVVAAVAALIHH
jgi:conjugative relaxase-like TrwC/TraI family protein